MAKNRKNLSVIPLGGVGEIGKNMTVIEYQDDIIVIDCGIKFPEEDMLGVDLVIPDITYLIENKNKVRGIIITHGHEDHIGALPYVLRQLDVPVYGTRLSLGLTEGRIKEHGLNPKNKPVVVSAGDKIKLGAFEIEFIRVNHSIADVVALAITTPVGVVIHTSDFKFDQTPIDGKPTDYHKLAEYGDKGVLLLMSDSTNAERTGYTLSERAVGEALDETFRKAESRIMVATFASNIHRIQQIIDAAWKHNRKVAVAGRSMVNVVSIAVELGYLSVPEGLLVDLDLVDRLPANRVVIISTGSQGEPMSALTRMAMAEHKKVAIQPGDTVIISASAIPGNEKLISKNIDRLFRQGAEVIYEEFSGMHVSGHASQEELKLMLNLIRPKYFMPVHGEYRHLVKHSKLAAQVGIPQENIFIPEIGDHFEFSENKAVLAGKVTAGAVLVDGLGVGDVGNIVLRDRRHLSQDGIVVVVATFDKQRGEILAGPDIVSRGFVYVRESEDLMDASKEKVKEILEKCCSEEVKDWSAIKNSVRDVLGNYLYEKTKRRPMILPIILEI